MILKSITLPQLELAIASAYQRYYEEQTPEVKKALERVFYNDWRNSVSPKPFQEFLCDFLAIGTNQRLQERRIIKFPIEMNDFFMLIDKQVKRDCLRLMEKIGKIHGCTFALRGAVGFFESSVQEPVTHSATDPKDSMENSRPKF